MGERLRVKRVTTCLGSLGINLSCPARDLGIACAPRNKPRGQSSSGVSAQSSVPGTSRATPNLLPSSSQRLRTGLSRGTQVPGPWLRQERLFVPSVSHCLGLGTPWSPSRADCTPGSARSWQPSAGPAWHSLAGQALVCRVSPLQLPGNTSRALGKGFAAALGGSERDLRCPGTHPTPALLNSPSSAAFYRPRGLRVCAASWAVPLGPSILPVALPLAA